MSGEETSVMCRNTGGSPKALEFETTEGIMLESFLLYSSSDLKNIYPLSVYVSLRVISLSSNRALLGSATSARLKAVDALASLPPSESNNWPSLNHTAPFMPEGSYEY